MGIKGLNTVCAWILLYKLLLVNDISGIDVTPLYQKKFDTVVLTANSSGQTSVRWDKDSITLTSCFVGPGFCPDADSLSGATIAIDNSIDESTITIHSANQTFHGGHYEATGSTAVDILVNTLPVTVNWTAQPQGNLTSVSSATWTAKIYCVYPTSEVNVDFTVYVDGVKEVSSRSPSLSTETDLNCDSPEETVVAVLTLLSSDFLNKQVYIIANASHATFPTEPSISSGQSAEAIFQLEGKVSKEVDDKTYDFIQYNGFVNLGGSGVSGGGCAQVLIHGTLTITAKKAGLLFFSNQYFIGGTVVYGIQIVFVSTAINTITIISGVVLLAIYFGKVQCIAIPYFILMAAAASMLSVLIFMAIVYLFGHKEFIHIKFKNRKKSKNMSSLGLKLPKNDTINFSFKVKAINACMTLHVLENGETESISKSRKVKMVLGDGFPENRVPNSRDSLICNIVSDTEYTSFCLNTENKHITLSNEQGGIILQWTCSAESFTVKDIEISNINQDDSTKDSSTEKEKEEKLDTPDEWIFWFRKGDTLCEIGEHEREIKEGLRCKQTVQLICVVIFPIAWLVMIVLMVKYLFKSKGKKADDNESEMSEQLNKKQKESSEQQNKKQKDTKGKRFDFTSFSCCHNSVKPNSTTDNKPKALPGSYLAKSPKGRNLPMLPKIRKPKKKDKKNKKIKNQDSNMNDKQQSHCDKQDLTVQPELTVAADTSEAE